MSEKPIKRTLSDGTIEWRRHGLLHREDGPAMIDCYKSRVWILDGKIHRKDGPAIITLDGIFGWYLYGKEYSLNTWCNTLRLSDERRVEIKLLYG